jgi:uncharacterized protein with PQ loop repeat
MNNLQKLFLYPVAIAAVVIINTSLCWLLTAFFAKIFSVEIGVAAASPMVFIYIVAFVGSLYMIGYACQYIDEEL